VAGFIALFLALALVRAADHPFPWYDDVTYLDRGNQLHELGGPAVLSAWAVTCPPP
jgi:hypothetical protein